ncbi:Armadillo repeat-containing protein 5 [Mactra antiquata]
MASSNFKNLTRQLYSSRIKYSYGALCEIRKKYMKDVPSLIQAGLVGRILEFVRTRDDIEEQYRSKVMMISLSILGNLCMENLTRKEVLKHRGIQSIVELYEETECIELLTRICRTLSNMMLDPCSWELVCCVTVTEKTVKTLKDTDDKDVQLTFIRAVRLFGSTDSHVQKLLTNNAVSVVLKYLDSEQQSVKDAVLRCIYSLSSHRCCGTFASQVITSRQLSLVMDLVKLEDIQTFDLISRLCEFHHFRAEFGNLGGIDILNDFIMTENGIDDKRIFDSISILCQCSKEAVNRLKLRDKCILPLFIRFLSDKKYVCLHCRIISALVSFLYDEEGFNILLENKLVSVLIKHLRKCIGFNIEGIDSINRLGEANNSKHRSGDVNISINRSEVNSSRNRTEEVNNSNNRTGDVNISINRSEVNSSKNRTKEVNNSKNRTRDVNISINRTGDVTISIYRTGDVNNSINRTEEVYNSSENRMVPEAVDDKVKEIFDEKDQVKNDTIDGTDKQTDIEVDVCGTIDIDTKEISKDGQDEIEMTCDGYTTKPEDTIHNKSADTMDTRSETISSTTKPIYNPHSPSYHTQPDWTYNDDSDNVTCISRFTPPPMANTGYSYSPLSVSSYDSPTAGSPGYTYSSPSTSPNSQTKESAQHSCRYDIPKYSNVVCQLYNAGLNSRDGAVFNNNNHDNISMVTGNYSPGGKSPSPSHLSDISDVHYKYTYSPVDTESENDSDENDIDNNIVDDEFDNEGKTEVGDKGKAERNYDMLNIDETTDFADDGRRKNTLSTSVRDKEMIDEGERDADMEKLNLDFTKVFLELDKIESGKTSTSNRTMDSEKDKVTEYNILILLSRVSQMTDPTMHLVTIDVFTCLLDYMHSSSMPLSRCPRLMSRIVRNPLCFQSLLSLNIPVLIYEKILSCENLALLVSKFTDNQKGKTRRPSDESIDDTVQPASKRRKTSDGHVFKGIDHKQEVECCETGSSAMALFGDFSSIIDSHYGRGTVENSLFFCNEEQRKKLCCSLLYITWSSESRQHFFNQKCISDTLTEILNPVGEIDSQNFISAINGLRVLFHIINTKKKYQHCSRSRLFSCHGNGRNLNSSSVVNEMETISSMTVKSSVDLNDCCSLGHEAADVCMEKCNVKNSSPLDVVFLVEGQTVSANRSILCAKSEIFSAMLEGHYSEASLSEVPVLECSRLAFELVIHYLHGCKTRTCSVMNNLFCTESSTASTLLCIDVLNEAHKYMLDELHNLAYSCLISKYIIPDSVYSVFKYAVLHRNEVLMKMCVSCIFYGSQSCTQAVKCCQEFITSQYVDLFLGTLTDILTE